MLQKPAIAEVVCFGELLWDILPSGALPGGAPMNVAYHLNKLGRRATLLSRVGNDERGQALLTILEGHGIDTHFIQQDRHQPTGVVIARANEQNEMEYVINQPVAWDFISPGDACEQLVQQAPWFVFGSLVTRNQHSRNTLYGLIEQAQNRVVDINLRAPHYYRSLVEYQLEKAMLLKLNLAELELISGWFANYTGIEDRMKFLQDKYYIPNLVVTLGADGAIFNHFGATYRHKGYRVMVNDTIGSGDSFLAALISKLIDKAPAEQALDFACATGALVASKPGGCPYYELQEISELLNNNDHSPFFKTKI